MSSNDLAENERPKECHNISTDLEDPTYYEAEQTFTTPPVISSNTWPQTKLKGTDPFSPDFHNRDKKGTDLCQTDNEVFNDNESDYSPKRNNGSDYVKLCRVSPTSQSSSSSLTDWKYSSRGYPSTDYNTYDYKAIGSKYDNKYDNGLDSWTQSADTNNKSHPKSYLSRSSVLNKFDPLIASEDKEDSTQNIYSKESKTNLNPWNDSTDLVNQFQKFKIGEKPKKVESNRFCAKPDVLAFAIDEKSNSNESIEKFDKYEKELKEKDITIDGLKEQLNGSTKENERLQTLINTFHNINEELVKMCDLFTEEKTKAIDERNGIEKSFSDLHIIYDRLRNDFTLSKENESTWKRQNSVSNNRIQELEKELTEKMNSDERKQFSVNEKRDLENELMASKVQNKKAEMRIKSLQNLLDQKSKENTELSSMVDEFIVKMQK